MGFASLLLLYKAILYIFFGLITLAETQVCVDSGLLRSLLHCAPHNRWDVGARGAFVLVLFMTFLSLFLTSLSLNSPSLLQKMWQRLVNYLVFNLLAVSAILDPRLDVVLKWGSWLLLMASMRLLCDLARNRFKALITYTPNAAWWIHGKIVTLLVLLLLADFAIFTFAMTTREDISTDQLFLVVSECFSLFVVAVGALIKYGTYYIDTVYYDGQWEHRGSYSYYTDLFSKSIILMVSLVYYATILHLHGVSLNIFFDILIIIRLVVIVVSLRTKFIAYQNYRQLSNHIVNVYKPLGPEELAEYNDDCAICRDPMNTALRLPCGHIFHTTCLRSWLEHNHNCPTCRYALIAQAPAPVTRATAPRHAPNIPRAQPPPPPPREPIVEHLSNEPLSPTASRASPSHPSEVLGLSSSGTTSSNPFTAASSSSAPSSTQAPYERSTSPEPNRRPVFELPTAPEASPSQQRAFQAPGSPAAAHRAARRIITSSSEATVRHEQMQANMPGSQSVWSFSSPSWLAWLPSLSVEVVRGQDPGIGGMDQRHLTVHRENLEQVRALFPDIPESVALADLIATQSLTETINNIIENRLSWSPSHVDAPAARPASPPARTETHLATSSSAPNSSSAPTMAPSSSSQASPSLNSPSSSITRPVNSPLKSRLVQSMPSSSAPSSSPNRRTPSPVTAETYQDRKKAMIEACREAYLQKHEK